MRLPICFKKAEQAAGLFKGSRDAAQHHKRPRCARLGECNQLVFAGLPLKLHE